MKETVPTDVEITHKDGCHHKFTISIDDLCGANIVIYKSADRSTKADETVTRSITCPNCDKLINVSVPKTWCNDA